MKIFKKDSLETLRRTVNLIDVLSPHVEFKKAGAAYKALCPFHDEKNPSFMIQKGDTHYHCFGCGAHGDAIQFLMTHQKMNFSEAVESLAERFHVHLETSEAEDEYKGPSKALLKEALFHSTHFFHFALLHSQEGEQALQYLYARGIDLSFIQQFQIGYSPKTPGLLKKILNEKKFSDAVLFEAGLLKESKGQYRDFFSDRILFPIHHYNGEVIGFSGRKYKEETYGGKYINTPETPLFKKSRVLFGLNYSRKQIAKNRKAIIVEGQIDALRLIQAGFNFTVAGQGTAFGDSHVKEIVNLGVNLVYLALDSDLAGKEAAIKIGHLFQKEGIEVKVLALPEGEDPDQFLMEKGIDAFLQLMESGTDYLSFLVAHHSKILDIESPAGKNELISQVASRIKEWNHPVMVHETLKKLANKMKVPEDYIGISQIQSPSVYIKKSASIAFQAIDPDRILETDFLRLLLLHSSSEPRLVKLARENIKKEDLHVPVCQKIYERFIENESNQRSFEILSFAIEMDDAEAQCLLSELTNKKINKEKVENIFIETIKKVLDRNWMEKREAIKIRIQSGQCSEDEVLALAKQFDDQKRNSPTINIE